MTGFSITLDELAEQMIGETWQPGDITVLDLMDKSGRNWSSCCAFLDAQPGLKKVVGVYVPQRKRRMNVYRPINTNGAK